jgi:hypothetical protein
VEHKHLATADASTMVTAIMTTMIITRTTTMTMMMMMIVVCCDYFGSLVHRTARLQFYVKRILSILENLFP